MQDGPEDRPPARHPSSQPTRHADWGATSSAPFNASAGTFGGAHPTAANLLPSGTPSPVHGSHPFAALNPPLFPCTTSKKAADGLPAAYSLGSSTPGPCPAFWLASAVR